MKVIIAILLSSKHQRLTAKSTAPTEQTHTTKTVLTERVTYKTIFTTQVRIFINSHKYFHKLHIKTNVFTIKIVSILQWEWINILLFCGLCKL